MLRNNKSTINANGCTITKALVLSALGLSELHWEMHQAQLFSLEFTAFNEERHATTAFNEEVHVTTQIEGEATRELFSKYKTSVTLMGIPVVVDNERYPKGLIRLMSGEIELSRIEVLGVPCAFGSNDDYTKEGLAREREKFAKLTY